jgi:hypothetical protein
MEQIQDEKIEKVLADLDRLGIPRERHEGEIRANISEGVANFATYDTFQRGEKYMDMEIRFDYNARMERHTVSAIEAAVLDVKIPAEISTSDRFKEVEFLLQYPPAIDMSQPNAQELYTQRAIEHTREIGAKLQTLHDQEPAVFDALVARYNPIAEVAVSPERTAAVEKILQDSTVSATFSSYYNLKPEEMFNLLTVDNSYVQKRLYKKAPEGQPNNFVGWVQPQLNQVHETGVTQMKLVNDFPLTEKLRSLNLVEVVDAAKFKFLDNELRKGGTMVVNNLNKTGDPRVLIKADPEGGSVQLTSLKSGKILSHNEYRKDPMVIIQTPEGSVVVGKKEAPEHFEPKATTTQERENVLQKKREQPTHVVNGADPSIPTQQPVGEQPAVSAGHTPAAAFDTGGKKEQQAAQQAHSRPKRAREVKTTGKQHGKHV